MNIDEFSVENWMTAYENKCEYNLTESSLQALTLNDLQQHVDEDIASYIMNISQDYGPIVGSHRLKAAILDLYETGGLDNVTIAHGTISANELVMMALLEPGDHIISLFPTYQQLYDFPKSLGCEISLIHLKEENHWIPHIDEFEKAFKKNTKMLCLNSPNNPTGTTLSKQLMDEIIELAKKHDCYILCDEIYRGVNTENNECTPSISDRYDKGIATQSLSKIFPYAGLRMGWIKANRQIINRINLRRDYHIISSGPMNDYLAALVLENKEKILKYSKDIILLSKNSLKAWLETEKHFSCVIPNEGTVAFLKYDYPISSKELSLRILDETGILFVPGSAFGVENHLRFGFTHDQNYTQEALMRLSCWLRDFEKELKTA